MEMAKTHVKSTTRKRRNDSKQQPRQQLLDKQRAIDREQATSNSNCSTSKEQLIKSKKRAID
jgi:hypothetical protein